MNAETSGHRPVQTWLIDICAEDCAELLAGSGLGRLGVVVNGRPEIFPVNHVYDARSGCVVFPTRARTKLHAALDWPWVARRTHVRIPVAGRALAPGWERFRVGRGAQRCCVIGRDARGVGVGQHRGRLVGRCVGPRPDDRVRSLMTVFFFFVVGFEIKQELVRGKLPDRAGSRAI